MNVVPLVDVVLVLLIIFMITASAMEFGLEIEVPTVKQTQTSVEEFPVVAIDRSGSTFLNERAVNINVLGDEIRRRFPGTKDVYLRSDKTIIWEQVSQVISILGAEKFTVYTVTRAEDIRLKGR
jgi:biopolymer transport protein ExbD